MHERPHEALRSIPSLPRAPFRVLTKRGRTDAADGRGAPTPITPVASADIPTDNEPNVRYFAERIILNRDVVGTHEDSAEHARRELGAAARRR